MRFLPVVERELRMAARRRSTYGLRLLVALAAFAVILWICTLPARGQQPTDLGKSLFAILTILAFAYCLLIGPFLTTDTISSEKREGTLGLLFLTDLSSFDVVLGKWVATSLAGFYGLLAVLPVLGIPLLLGGVTQGEYGRVALAVVNAILFSLTAAMFVSALSREQTKAILGSFILILFLSGLLPGLMVLLIRGFLGRGVAGFPPVALASPIYTGQFALEAAYRTNPKLFWMSLGTVHALCWVFMIATMIIVARVWRQDPVESGQARLWLLRLGRTSRWQRRLKRRLEQNPIFALASRHRWPHWVFWALVGIVTINIYWLTIGVRQNPAATPFHQRFSLAMVFINRVWIAAMACRFLVEARRGGALEIILTTPLPIKTILRGRRRALLRLFFWPVLAIAVLHWWFVWGTWKPVMNQFNNVAVLRGQSLHAAGSLISFLTDVVALSAVGGWLSVSSRNLRVVVLKTFLIVTLIPWLLQFFISASRIVQSLAVSNSYWQFLVWPTVWVTKNMLLFGWAAFKMRRHFRAAAAQTYAWRRSSTNLPAGLPRPDFSVHPAT
jgi:ABC-type transport system involved in multi-copper enzyme maturation permease subunit